MDIKTESTPHGDLEQRGPRRTSSWKHARLDSENPDKAQNPVDSSPSEFMDGPARTSQGKGKTSFLRELLEWVLYILAAFVLASLIQSEVFALTEVNMSSMESTLMPRDKLVMNKLAYRARTPDPGDILIFLKDERADGFSRRMSIYLSDVSKKLHGDFRRNRLIKRVIAVPGDTVEIRDNQVLVNKTPLQEAYARVDPDYGMVVNGEMAPLTVPEGMLFVMGDNRGKSLDSRSFGFVPMTSVEGEAVFRVMPLNGFGKINP